MRRSILLFLAAWTGAGCAGGEGDTASQAEAVDGDACTRMTITRSAVVGTNGISSLDVFGDVIVVGTEQSDTEPAAIHLLGPDLSLRATHTLPGFAFVAGVTALADGTIVASTANDSADFRLTFLRPDRSTFERHEPGAGRIDHAPAQAKDGTIVVGTDTGKIVFLHPDGTTKGTFNGRVGSEFHGFVDASPLVLSDGSVVAISSEPRYVTFLRPDATLKSAFFTGAFDTLAAHQSFSPVLLPDNTVVATGDRAAMLFSRDGQRLATLPIASEVTPILESDGTLVLLGTDGRLSLVKDRQVTATRSGFPAGGFVWNGGVVLNKTTLAFAYQGVSDDGTHLLLTDQGGNEKQRSDLFTLSSVILRKQTERALVVARTSPLHEVSLMTCGR